jgi:hypothetical protein
LITKSVILAAVMTIKQRLEELKDEKPGVLLNGISSSNKFLVEKLCLR